LIDNEDVHSLPAAASLDPNCSSIAVKIDGASDGPLGASAGGRLLAVRSSMLFGHVEFRVLVVLAGEPGPIDDRPM
jgi:hypothetical protein